jgi:ketosteroid isomerase-like protein
MSSIDHLKRYLRAIEEFAPADVLATFFTADVVQQEFPNRLFAGGRRHDLTAMLGASDKGRQILASQQYELKNVVAEGDRVAAEIEWTGVLRDGFGPLAAGATMRAALGMFFRFRDGKIASIHNYDCYYPF